MAKTAKTAKTAVVVREIGAYGRHICRRLFSLCGSSRFACRCSIGSICACRFDRFLCCFRFLCCRGRLRHRCWRRSSRRLGLLLRPPLCLLQLKLLLCRQLAAPSGDYAQHSVSHRVGRAAFDDRAH